MSRTFLDLEFEVSLSHFSTQNKTWTSHFLIFSLLAQIAQAVSSTPTYRTCLAHSLILECHKKLWNLLSCKYIPPVSLKLPHTLGFWVTLASTGRLSGVQAAAVRWWYKAPNLTNSSQQSFHEPTVPPVKTDHSWFESQTLFSLLLRCKDIIWVSYKIKCIDYLCICNFLASKFLILSYRLSSHLVSPALTRTCQASSASQILQLFMTRYQRLSLSILVSLYQL